MTLERKVAALATAAIVALGVFIYSATLSFPFVYDDASAITQNRGIRLNLDRDASSAESWRRLRLLQPTPRPVANASFALNYAAGGLEVRGYRGVNIAIHILASLGVALLSWIGTGALARRSGGGSSPSSGAGTRLAFAAFAGLVFVAHPLATQSVTYIVQRMTSLSTLFYVLALCLWFGGSSAQRQGRSALGWRVSATAVWLLAMGSKEIAATWPVAIWLWEWQVERRGDEARAFARQSVPWVLGFAGLGAGVVWAYSSGDPFGDYDRKPFTWVERLWTEPRVWWSYVGLALAPLPSRLSVIHEVEMSRGWFAPWTTALSIAGWLGVIWGVFRGWPRHAALSAVGVWWLLQQSVEGTVLPLEPMYEHRTYLPMVAVCALAPWGLWNAFGLEAATHRAARRGFTLAGLLLVAALAAASVQRNGVWSDNVALWSDAAEKAPGHPVAQSNLGVALLAAGRLDEARAPLNAALALGSSSHTAHQNLGALEVAMGRFAEAEPHFRAALAIESIDSFSIAGLGAVAMEAGRADEAIALHRRSLAIRVDPRVQTNLGQILFVLGQYEAASAEFRNSLAIDPMQSIAWRKLSEASEALGDLDGATAALERLATLQADIWNAPGFALRLASLHERAGRIDRAEIVLERAAQAARTHARGAAP